MIDKKTFQIEFGVLTSRFNTTPDTVVIRTYFEILNEELTTEQFQMAVKQAFRHETFFPSPQKLIDYALGAEQDRAEIAWTDLIEKLRRGANQLTAPDSVERKVLNRIGGYPAVRDADQKRLDALRKDWVKFFVLELRGVLPALPGTSQSTGGQNALHF